MAIVRAIAWVFVFYFVIVYGGRVLLQLLGVPALLRGLALRPFHDMPAVYSGFDPPVSVILPAAGEIEATLRAVDSLLQLDYPQFELIVVCDGEADATLAGLQERYQLEAFPEALWRRIPSAEVRTVYQSKTHDQLRVLDKEPGGRADAVNAGINASRYPLLCAVDADWNLERESLLRLVEPFLEDPATVACAASMRLGEGEAWGTQLPRSLLTRLQIAEGLPMHVFRRLGWDALGAMVPMAGDLIVFRKDVVVEANGFRIDSDCEDSELAVRLHRALRARDDRYSLRFVPDPVAWRRSDASLAGMARALMRWQHGLAASVRRNAALFSARSLAREPAAPLLALLESYGPVVEAAAYLFMAAMFVAGLLPGAMFAAFVAMAVALGFLGSATALLLETLSAEQYPGLRQLARLALAALIENLGYRQATTFLRVAGLAPRRRPTA